MNLPKINVKSVRSKDKYRTLVAAVYVRNICIATLINIAYAFFMGDVESFLLGFLVLGCAVALPLSFIHHYFLHIYYFRTSIVVRENRVYCTSMFDHETSIPISQISSVTVNSKRGDSIALTSAGTRYQLNYISNCSEIYFTIISAIDNYNLGLLSTHESNVSHVSTIHVEDKPQKPQTTQTYEKLEPADKTKNIEQKPVQHIENEISELFWICGNCKTKNLASRSDCWSCGNKK